MPAKTQAEIPLSHLEYTAGAYLPPFGMCAIMASHARKDVAQGSLSSLAALPPRRVFGARRGAGEFGLSC
jgi:hypothetical protein